jgi:hypothetical protein
MQPQDSLPLRLTHHSFAPLGHISLDRLATLSKVRNLAFTAVQLPVSCACSISSGVLVVVQPDSSNVNSTVLAENVFLFITTKPLLQLESCGEDATYVQGRN